MIQGYFFSSADLIAKEHVGSILFIYLFSPGVGGAGQRDTGGQEIERALI